MIGHLFRLAWNRRRANAMVALEIGVSFLVLFAVVSIAAFALANYRRPLGFAWEDVLNVEIDTHGGSDRAFTPREAEALGRLLRAARELPEVEVAAAADSPPYSFRSSIGDFTADGGRQVEFAFDAATDEFKDLLHLEVVRGRWFAREDRGAAYTPVVINQALARVLFGGADPVGNRLHEPYGSEKEARIVGVITDFRGRGELSGPENVLFHRVDLDDPSSDPARSLLVRVKPGTPRSFEEKLAKKLLAVEPRYSFEVSPLAELRETMLRLREAPILAAAVVAVFLMLMVGLGLTGVLWQNVTRRTEEIGLRRAKGATEADIHGLILGEIFVITSVGIAAGAAVALQLPLLGLLGSVGGEVYTVSFVVSVVVLFALTTLCGLYPSRLAARVQPAEALHYE